MIQKTFLGLHICKYDYRKCLQNVVTIYHSTGTAVAQCCSTNRKVAGSMPAGASGFFIDIKSFRSHYGPGVDSASNRKEYQEYFLGGKGGRCVRLTTYHHPVPLSWNLGTLTSWNPLGHSGPVTGLLYLFTSQHNVITQKNWILMNTAVRISDPETKFVTLRSFTCESTTVTLTNRRSDNGNRKVSTLFHQDMFSQGLGESVCVGAVTNYSVNILWRHVLRGMKTLLNWQQI